MASRNAAPLLGGIEAGGTKFVLAVGPSPPGYHLTPFPKDGNQDPQLRGIIKDPQYGARE